MTLLSSVVVLRRIYSVIYVLTGSQSLKKRTCPYHLKAAYCKNLHWLEMEPCPGCRDEIWSHFPGSSSRGLYQLLTRYGVPSAYSTVFCKVRTGPGHTILFFTRSQYGWSFAYSTVFRKIPTALGQRRRLGVEKGFAVAYPWLSTAVWLPSPGFFLIVHHSFKK